MNALRRLEAIRAEYGADAGARKVALLRELERARLTSAKSVERLHETLCFLRAYPDDPAVLAQVERMLGGFASRSDLRRFAGALVDTGIAGTDIHYRFYADTAWWLAKRWGDRLVIDWDELSVKQEELLLDRLTVLAHYAETPGLDEAPLALDEWLNRMKAPGETDGAFLVRRFEGLDADPFLKQQFFEEVDLPLRLRPGPDTPARTRARTYVGDGHVCWQRVPLRRQRPDLRRAVKWQPRVRAVDERNGEALIDLAREAMVTRQRDLDVFMHGDPRDVRILDCGDGLAFAAIGFKPERRLLLEAVYGFLTLKNGVPIGYVLNSALFGSAEIAYNVFETYRGAEAGHVYGWVVACVRHLFGVDAFTIYPYQLGQANDEALDSGAWWFYQKLGFRPRDKAALALMNRELERMARRPQHRSSRATLERLADHNVYYYLGRERRDVIGEVSLSTIGLAVTEYLARRFGSASERGERECARETARRLGVRSFSAWSAGEKMAWRRWAPLLLLARGVEKWTAAEKRAAVATVRAKGGRRESDFVRRFDGHRKLRSAILALSR